MSTKWGTSRRNGERATHRCSTCKKLMRFDTAIAPFYCPRCDTGILQKVREVTAQMEAEHEGTA